MRILIVGGGGFIGSRITALLRSRGHEVLPCGRDPAALARRFPASIPVSADLARDGVADWLPRLGGVHAVINAAGALSGDLEALQARGPSLLFQACATAGIARVVQISALGTADGSTRFLTTKQVADACLLRLRDAAEADARSAWCVIRPSLVVGRGGASTGMLTALGALPVPVLLGLDGGWLQPLHVGDLARAVADLLEASRVPPVLDLVGPEPMEINALILMLRAWLGLPARRAIRIPGGILRAAATLGQWLPGCPLTPDMLAMLARGSTAQGDAWDIKVAVLGWSPAAVQDALAGEPAVAADLIHARLLAVRPALRLSLVTVWIGSALVTLFLASRAASDAMMARLGLHGWMAFLGFYGGAALDLVVGLGLLLSRRTAILCAVQLLVMLVYTVLATIAAPSLWSDPFGPLLKNAAIAGAALALFAASE